MKSLSYLNAYLSEEWELTKARKFKTVKFFLWRLVLLPSGWGCITWFLENSGINEDTIERGVEKRWEQVLALIVIWCVALTMFLQFLPIWSWQKTVHLFWGDLLAFAASLKCYEDYVSLAFGFHEPAYEKYALFWEMVSGCALIIVSSHELGVCCFSLMFCSEIWPNEGGLRLWLWDKISLLGAYLDSFSRVSQCFSDISQQLFMPLSSHLNKMNGLILFAKI